MFPGGPDNLNIGLLMSEQVSLEKHPNQGLVGCDCLPLCLPRAHSSRWECARQTDVRHNGGLNFCSRLLLETVLETAA